MSSIRDIPKLIGSAETKYGAVIIFFTLRHFDALRLCINYYALGNENACPIRKAHEETRTRR